MIWLVGAKGMLGSYLPTLFQEAGEPFILSDLEVDITDRLQVDTFAGPHPIKTIINCAAFTDVRACETKYNIAYKVNAEGPRNLADFASRKDALLIHVSTDYVFDGSTNKPYSEVAPTNPLNAYGKSKLEGEKLIQASSCRWTIVRTSWLYGKTGNNFVYGALSRLKKTGRMKVVNDQFGKPTYAADLAQALLALRFHPHGLYHFANSGTTTWFDFAKEIARIALEFKTIENQPQMKAVNSDEFNDPVKRPPFSALSTEKIEAVLKAKPRAWSEALRDFMLEIRENPFPLEDKD